MKRFFRSIFSLRFLVRLLFVIVALTTIVALGFAGLVVYWKTARDIPPPDLSALTPHRVNVPDAENGFLLLEKLKLPQSEEERGVLINALFPPNHHWYKWDQPKIDSLLAKYHDTLAALDQALALPKFQFPIETPAQPAYYLISIRTASQLESLLAEDQFRKGNHEAAFADALKIIDFGKRVENGDGELVHYLVGASIALLGRVRVEKFVNQTGTADRSTLEECLQKVSVPFDETSAFQNSIRGSMKYSQKAVSGLTNIYSVARENSFPNFVIHSWQYRYKPNRNLQWIAQTDQLMMNLAPMNYAEMQSHLPAKRKGWEKWMRHWETILFSSNAVSELIQENTIPPADLLSRKCFEQTNRAMLQTMIALRLYALDHNGALPDSLTAIAPQYLPSVPLDDFDGKPIRYSKAHRVIYSVGTKLKDNGGTFPANSWNTSESPHLNLAWK